MRKPILLAVVLGACALAMAVSMGAWAGSPGTGEETSSQLCVVWSSGDPGVAKTRTTGLQVYTSYWLCPASPGEQSRGSWGPGGLHGVTKLSSFSSMTTQADRKAAPSTARPAARC